MEGGDPETWDFCLCSMTDICVPLGKLPPAAQSQVSNSKMEFEGVDSLSGREDLQESHAPPRAACGRKNMLEIGMNGPALTWAKATARLTVLTRQERARSPC